MGNMVSGRLNVGGAGSLCLIPVRVLALSLYKGVALLFQVEQGKAVLWL